MVEAETSSLISLRQDCRPSQEPLPGTLLQCLGFLNIPWQVVTLQEQKVGPNQCLGTWGGCLFYMMLEVPMTPPVCRWALRRREVSLAAGFPPGISFTIRAFCLHLQGQNKILTSQSCPPLHSTVESQNDSLDWDSQSLWTNNYLIQEHTFRPKQLLVMKQNKTNWQPAEIKCFSIFLFLILIKKNL